MTATGWCVLSAATASNLARNGEGRNRTGDTTVFSRVLYQLSYLAAAGKSSSGSEPIGAARCTTGMRLLVIVLTAAIAAVLAPQVSAKEDVVARLENPAALRAPAGSRIVLAWTLRAGKRPFTAAGIYVRLHGRAGTNKVGWALESAPGRYRARLTIPKGGVRAVRIGLEGWSTGPGGTKRADWLFPIANDPLP